MKNKKGNKREIEEEMDKEQTIKHIFKTKEKDIFNIEYNNLVEELKSDNYTKMQPFVLSNFIQCKITQLSHHQELIKDYLSQPESGNYKLKQHINLEDFKEAKDLMKKKYELNMLKCEDLIKEDLKKLTTLTKKRKTNTPNEASSCSSSASSSNLTFSAENSKESSKSFQNKIKNSDFNYSDNNIKLNFNNNDHNKLNINDFNLNEKANENDSDYDFKRERFFGKGKLDPNSTFNYSSNFNKNKNKNISKEKSISNENDKSLSSNKNSNGKASNNSSSNINQESNKNTITIKDEEPPAIKIKLTYADGKDTFPQYLSISSTEFESYDEFLTVLKKKLGIYKYARFKLVYIVNNSECFYISSVQQLLYDRVNEIKVVPEDYDI